MTIPGRRLQQAVFAGVADANRHTGSRAGGLSQK